MSDYKKKIEAMTFSFSRRDSWETCKYGWKLSYLDKREQLQNGWSDAGTLGHDIFEQYDKGEIKLEDMATQWADRYDAEVVNPFPSFSFPVSKAARPWLNELEPGFSKKYIGLFHNYKWKVYKFFKEFRGFSSETVGVEEKFTIELSNGSSFLGYIDRVSMSNEELIVVDYKISNPDKFEIEKKKRQILLYAEPIKAKYGKYPSKAFFFFFQNGRHIGVDINEEAVNEAMQWMVDGIEEIKEATEFPPIIEEGKDVPKFCSTLCGHRGTCEFYKNRQF